MVQRIATRFLRSATAIRLPSLNKCRWFIPSTSMNEAPVIGHVAFKVEGETTMQQFKRKLDAAGLANSLKTLGTSLSLRFNDPNGLILEFMTKVQRLLEYEKPRDHPLT